jgi:hypothetical protein
MAWRLARRETRRSEARVAALAAAIHGPEGALGAVTAAAIETFPSEHAAAAVAPGPTPGVTGRRSFAMLLATAVVAAGLVLVAAVRRAGNEPQHRVIPVPAVSSAAVLSARPAQTGTAAAPPLELIALSHERVKDTLIVRGAIRNPSKGLACDVPAVVVLTFDERGIFLASNESEAGGERLPPGSRVTFSVSVPATTTPAARYKVSFRSAGRVVPHVDRRDRPAGAGGTDGVATPPRPAGARSLVQS